jgi:hypothetical protein
MHSYALQAASPAHGITELRSLNRLISPIEISIDIEIRGWASSSKCSKLAQTETRGERNENLGRPHFRSSPAVEPDG